MARKKISQREAQRMRRKLREINEKLGRMANGFGGITTRRERLGSDVWEFIRTARQFDGIVVLEDIHDGQKTIELRAHRRPDV